MRFISAPRTRDLLGAALSAACLIPCTDVQAQLSWTGDVDPSDPSTWSTFTEFYIGNTGTGTLTIGPGAVVDNWRSYIGFGPSADGTITVTGPNTLWEPFVVYVGYSGTGTLVVEGGGVYDDSSTYVGHMPGAVGHVIVRDSGSRIDSLLTIGDDGDGTLLVESGGVVDGSVSIASGLGSTGSATVRGAGSRINGSLDIGGLGLGTLLVEQGGRINGGSDSISSGSTATITGASSIWTTSRLTVGSTGNGELLVDLGASVSVGEDAQIGSSGSTNSSVTVRGAGSQLDVTNDLNVGWLGNGELYIEDGGLVTVSGQTWLGYASDASGSIHMDNGSLSTWGLVLSSPDDLHGTGTINTFTLMADLDLVFDAANGLAQTLVFNSQPGQNISLNLNLSLPISNTGAFGVGNRGLGTLRIADGRVIEAGQGYLGYETNSEGSATITGNGSKWVATDIDVGRRGDGFLVIEQGGVMESGSGAIGIFSSSIGSVTVTGTGSRWDNAGRLTVGSSGSATLAIEDGGVVNVNDTTWLGTLGMIALDNGTLNTAGLGTTLNDLQGTGTINTNTLITDGDLKFDATHGLVQTMTLNGLPGRNITLNIDASNPANNTGALGTGYRGEGTLLIADGRQLQSERGYVGYGVGSEGTATVTGAGSQWTTPFTLYVGYEGTGELSVEDGGVVSNGWGQIGSEEGGSGTVHVNGAGSQWNLINTLYVGYRSTGALAIDSGGVVNTNWLSVADWDDSEGTIVLSGPGSQLNANRADVGMQGAATLLIEDGAVFTSGFSTIGDRDYNPDWDGPPEAVSVTVTGTGSQWNLSSDLEMSGPHSSLTIEAGGVVNSRLGQAGGDVTIRGAGSQWNNTSGLISGGLFAIESGGVLNSTFGEVYGSAIVTGAGSQWNSTGELGFFGYEGGVVTVQVQAGGVVNSGTTQIGGSPFGFDEPGTVVATLTGAGTQWNATNGLHVLARNSEVNILSGAVLTSNVDSAQPFFAESTINDSGQVRVSGIGSQWINAGSIIAGSEGEGTLVVDAGGVVFTDDAYVGGGGFFGGDGVGVVRVSGDGSEFNTNSSFVLGDDFQGTGTLTVDNGAMVNTGELSIGRSGMGTVNIDGGSIIVGNDLDMQGSGGDAQLNFTLGSSTNPLIDVGNQADLAGVLGFSVDSAFTLDADDTFTLIGVGNSLFGTFENADEGDLLAISDGLGLRLTYAGGDGNDVVAYVSGPAMAGDLDGDDDVDDDDLAMAISNFTGSTGSGMLMAHGDWDYDGDVDNKDLGFIIGEYTRAITGQSLSLLASVPEPTTLGLLMFGGLLGLRRR